MLLLDKDSKRILKYIISQSKRGDFIVIMCDVPQNLSIKPKHVVEICKHLEEVNLIKAVYFSDTEVLEATLTHQGLVYLDLKRKEFFKSIFTPITITILTNLIIFALKWLLPHLKLLLAYFLQ